MAEHFPLTDPVVGALRVIDSICQVEERVLAYEAFEQLVDPGVAGGNSAHIDRESLAWLVRTINTDLRASVDAAIATAKALHSTLKEV